MEKLKEDPLIIKKLLKKGYKQCQISRLLGKKKEKWAIVSENFKSIARKMKKVKGHINLKHSKMGTNKTTSFMSSKKISSKFNLFLRKRNEANKRGKLIIVYYTIINNYLKWYYGKPRIISFFMSKKNRKEKG